MSDSLGDGAGQPTDEQCELYRRWARADVGLSLIGEVQVGPRYPEKPGNLVLAENRDRAKFEQLAAAGSEGGSWIWPQLGHAGALAFEPLSNPAGPSALDIAGLRCRELTVAEIEAIPQEFASAARRAKNDGFRGVEVHAGHGFLLSQFLSPLFNRRTDGYGGSIEARCRVVVEIVRAVRGAVGPDVAVGMRINSSDQLDGGLTEDDSAMAIEIIASEGLDLVDISGGTYFPGAPSSSDRQATGPYFVDFARQVRENVSVPVMVTGGFKTFRQAHDAVASGATDAVGLARALVVDPDLASHWFGPEPVDPVFPHFDESPPGGVTAWYTMRLADIAAATQDHPDRTPQDALREYDRRDEERIAPWIRAFGAAE